MSFLNKYKKWKTTIHILFDKYLDFVLSLNNTPTVPLNGKVTEKCLSAYMDASIFECNEDGSFISTSAHTYEGCINSGCTLENIGYTGIDNGLISYDISEISNREFYEIFTSSKYVIDTDDCRLKLNPVTGNTGEYVYDYEYHYNSGKTGYYELKGGFLQGFYKLSGYDYEVIPQYIENEWNVEITIRPKDYEISNKTLNNTHENTDGFIFYMGIRAENKFLRVYNCDYSSYPDRFDEYDYQSKATLLSEEYFLPDDYYDPYENTPLSFYEDKYCSYIDSIYGDDVCDTSTTATTSTTTDSTETNNKSSNKKCLAIGEFFTNMYADPYPPRCGCSESTESLTPACSTYANDDYFAEEDSSVEDNTNPNFLALCSDDYFTSTDLSDVELTTSDGTPIDERGYTEIKTDNKFLTYDRTKDGLKAPNKGDDIDYVYKFKEHKFKDNPFLLFNRTCTGYTTHNFESYYENEDEYDFLPDLKGNCFGIRVKEDGSIGYRYFMKDCDSESGFTVAEEYSYPNLIKKDEWNTINIKFKILNGSTDNCGVPYGERKMKIYIYVNGYLKMVSKVLKEFDFRALDEADEKQEGVPFNISVGGGTQGLCDSVWLDYYTPFEKILPIEQNFAGTFIGDIKSFKFYTCELEFNEIKNNYLHECVVI